MEDEKLIHIIDGLYEDVAVLLFSTDSRIIFKGLGIDLIEIIPHEKITSIHYSDSRKELEIVTEEKTFRLEKSNTNLTPKFYTAVNAFLKGDAQESSDPETSVLELLEQLGKLKENGVLTYEEFTEQKKKLLEKL